jgi:hypothetical protein
VSFRLSQGRGEVGDEGEVGNERVGGRKGAMKQEQEQEQEQEGETVEGVGFEPTKA